MKTKISFILLFTLSLSVFANPIKQVKNYYKNLDKNQKYAAYSILLRQVLKHYSVSSFDYNASISQDEVDLIYKDINKTLLEYRSKKIALQELLNKMHDHLNALDSSLDKLLNQTVNVEATMSKLKAIKSFKLSCDEMSFSRAISLIDIYRPEPLTVDDLNRHFEIQFNLNINEDGSKGYSADSFIEGTDGKTYAIVTTVATATLAKAFMSEAIMGKAMTHLVATSTALGIVAGAAVIYAAVEMYETNRQAQKLFEENKKLFKKMDMNASIKKHYLNFCRTFESTIQKFIASSKLIEARTIDVDKKNDEINAYLSNFNPQSILDKSDDYDKSSRDLGKYLGNMFLKNDILTKDISMNEVNISKEEHYNMVLDLKKSLTGSVKFILKNAIRKYENSFYNYLKSEESFRSMRETVTKDFIMIADTLYQFRLIS